ncbi:hypothetical protein HDU82_007558 [Entophlyctis luteolus]|nr:hypothetical protein HDU82_007558 [Entophlyctis luteolus]
MPRPSFSDPSLDYRLRFAKESGAYTRDASAASEILARIRFAFLNLRTRFNLKKHALAKAAATSSATTAVAASPWAYRVNTATSASTTGSTTRWSDVSATGLHHVASQGAESSSREGTVAGTSAVNTLGPSSYSSAPIHVRGTVESFERRWREAGSRRDTSYGGDLLDFSANGSLPRS